MIGNDVVDLALAREESNWQRAGFLQKLFTKAEQQLISNATFCDVMVWNLWSRKEAAYKIYNRDTGQRRFMPLQLECIYESESHGKVICEGRCYYTQTTTTKACIATIAVVNESDFSKIVILENSLELHKENGIPFYYDRPVSISHHGNFKQIVTL